MESWGKKGFTAERSTTDSDESIILFLLFFFFFQGSEDSNPPSPDQYPVQREPPINGGMPPLDTKLTGDSTSTINSKNNLDAKTAEMVQHLLMMNGHHDNKMAALQSFQNLQNLATGLQNLNSVSSLVAGLQGLTGERHFSNSIKKYELLTLI